MPKQVNFKYTDADLELLAEASEAYLYPATSADLVRALLRYPEKLVAHRAEARRARQRVDVDKQADRAARQAKREQKEHVEHLTAAWKAAQETRDAFEKQIGLEPFNHPAVKREQPEAYARWEGYNARVKQIYDQRKAAMEGDTT